VEGSAPEDSGGVLLDLFEQQCHRSRLDEVMYAKSAVAIAQVVGPTASRREHPRKTDGMQRVAVVGSGGAGKTTFATELGRLTGLPVIHLDRVHWKPGWVEPPRDQWAKDVAELTTGERWVIDGNYGGTFEIRFERADTVIVLALSRWRCTSRVLRRTLTHYGREVQAEGCPERLDFTFVRWVWRYPKDSRRHLDAVLDHFKGGVRVIELRTPREVRRFLTHLGADSA